MTREEYHNDYLNSAHWKATHAKRLALDSHKCYLCGYNHNLNVHHITYLNIGNENVQKDLVTLCDMCHLMVHNILDRTHDDYKEFMAIKISPRNVDIRKHALKVLYTHC